MLFLVTSDLISCMTYAVTIYFGEWGMQPSGVCEWYELGKWFPYNNVEFEPMPELGSGIWGADRLVAGELARTEPVCSDENIVSFARP